MKPRAIEYKLSPQVLIWARQSMGRSVDESAKKLGVKSEKLQDWEKGKGQPTFNQLEKMAYSVYRRPIAVFFRTEPPKEKPLQKDFRTIPQSIIKSLSPEMRLVIRKAKRLQNILIELHEENPKGLIYRNFKVTIRDNPINTAKRFREFVKLRIEDQKKWKAEDSFNNFKTLVEKQGIYVFQFEMPFEEARGFSLTDDFPIVVLNSNDSKNGRIFSLFHEVCHILFNVGGIFRDSRSRGLLRSARLIEDFCNKFAAEFLVPEELFKDDIKFENQEMKEWSDSDLIKLSKLYKVSPEVVLRKLVDLKLATKEFYFYKKKLWDNAMFARKKSIAEKSKQEGRPIIRSQVEKTLTEKGKTYIGKVMDYYENGKIAYSDISEYLDVKLDYIPKILEKLTK
jgi:Zn-dependent peptidase ImmA (M78 family)